MKKIQFKAADGRTWVSLCKPRTVEEARDFISSEVGAVRSGFFGYRYEIREIDE